jgi:spore germination cell wall hydrolase CwlJ-like protein
MLICANVVFVLLVGCIVLLPERQEEPKVITQEELRTEYPMYIFPHQLGGVAKAIEKGPFEQAAPAVEIDPPKYEDEDLLLLARLIEAEGGIESYQCKLYIGSVVLNRMVSDEFPDSLHDVIFQVNKNGTHQFSVTIVRKDGTKAIDCTPSEESLEAAAELLTYGTQLPADVMVFYAEYCKGKWVTSREPYTQVDHTVFAHIYARREE